MNKNHKKIHHNRGVFFYFQKERSGAFYVVKKEKNE